MRRLSKIASVFSGMALAVVVNASTAHAQYAGAGSAGDGGGLGDSTGAGTTQQLTEAGLYGFGLLALAALIVALYVYAPRVKDSTK